MSYIDLTDEELEVYEANESALEEEINNPQGERGVVRQVRCFLCGGVSWLPTHWSPHGKLVVRQHCSLQHRDMWLLMHKSSPVIRLTAAIARLETQLSRASTEPARRDLSTKLMEYRRGLDIQTARANERAIALKAKGKK